MKNEIISEIQAKQKQFISHTTIINVPNGIRIVTELVRDENRCKVPEQESKTSQTDDDGWTSKFIEVALPKSEILKKFQDDLLSEAKVDKSV